MLSQLSYTPTSADRTLFNSWRLFGLSGRVNNFLWLRIS